THPALIDVVAIALYTGIQDVPDGLDHGIGQRDVEIPTAAVELDVKTRDHHCLRGRDDVRELGVDLHIEKFEVHLQHRIPRLTQVRERLIEDHANHPHLRGRELAPFDLGEIAPVTTEEIVNQDEHQLGIQHAQGRPSQRMDLHQIEAGG